jgi:spermidine synthase
MTWLIGWKFYRSEKNGVITCRRLFGRWEVFVGGFHESSRYLRDIWRDAYDARLPAGFAPKRILMFGLAAGDNVRLLHDRWPAASVTAIEWDPVMVRIADDLRLYPTAWRPEVVVTDAAEAAATLQGSYDLILVDVFNAGRVAKAVYDGSFYAGVKRLLAPGGLVLANAFLEPAALDAASAQLREISRWKTKHNRMGLFAAA